MGSALVRVSCIGDSITAGFGLEDWDDSYPNQLYYILGDRYVVNPNLGKSGAAVWRHSLLPYKNTKEYREAIGWSADVLVICLGANDTVYQINDSFCQEFIEDYIDLIGNLKSKMPDARVFVCKVPPMFGKENARFAASVPVINELIVSVAQTCGARVIDLNRPFASKAGLFSDGLHPNKEGARLIAETVSTILIQEFK